jgi:hypothetical protein
VATLHVIGISIHIFTKSIYIYIYNYISKAYVYI